MLSSIEKITAMQYTKILENAKRNGTFIAEISGKNIKNIHDYLSEVWKAFHFPQIGRVNYYAYLDWIRDLDWLNADVYILAIRDFTTFMDKSPKERKIVLKSFEDTVIPWWDSEVEKFQVEGKLKSFKIYLVD